MNILINFGQWLFAVSSDLATLINTITFGLFGLSSEQVFFLLFVGGLPILITYLLYQLAKLVTFLFVNFKKRSKDYVSKRY